MIRFGVSAAIPETSPHTQQGPAVAWPPPPPRPPGWATPLVPPGPTVVLQLGEWSDAGFHQPLVAVYSPCSSDPPFTPGCSGRVWAWTSTTPPSSTAATM